MYQGFNYFRNSFIGINDINGKAVHVGNSIKLNMTDGKEFKGIVLYSTATCSFSVLTEKNDIIQFGEKVLNVEVLKDNKKYSDDSYEILDVAKLISNYSIENGFVIDSQKLQKLLYYTQKNFMLLKKIPCFKEDMTKNNLGAFSLKVYDKYKFDLHFKKINKEDIKFTLNDDFKFIYTKHQWVADDIFYEMDKQLIYRVVEEYKDLNGVKMVELNLKDKLIISTTHGDVIKFQ